MTITRVNEFIAQDGKSEEMADYLASIIPLIESSEGCLYAHLLRGMDNPARFLVIETWESIAAHQLSVEGVDKKEFLRAMEMLAEKPKAEYFQS
ncbi:MAG TPA: antibiotic biosynthesis monooxygenase family protein [Gammaproteobacteria bacterium]